MDLRRLEKTLHEMNQFGRSKEGVTRLAYSKEERQAAEHFSSLCRKEGMDVRIDTCGNVIARREGSNPDLPVVACGSHLDTVIQGGNYDGVLGVIAALEVIRSLNEKGVTTEHPIEIIAFACEESSRFGVSTIGSKAMAGILEKESLSELSDSEGKFLRDIFSECSLNFNEIDKSTRQKEEFKVFLEMHIEQGPVLERQQKQIGIVTGIAAPTRFEVKIKGQASHSGTTPMDYRRDAFLSAAEIALQLERAAKMEAGNGTVATVGACEVKPGSMNVIPDLATMKIDIRGTSTDSKNRVIKSLFTAVKQVEQKRNVSIEYSKLSDEHPINLDREVIEFLSQSCEQKGYTYTHIASGAGHDAMNMAMLCPTGLLFVPSKNGLSHHPGEYTKMEQIGIGADLLEMAIIEWAGYSQGVNRSKIL